MQKFSYKNFEKFILLFNLNAPLLDILFEILLFAFTRMFTLISTSFHKIMMLHWHYWFSFFFFLIISTPSELPFNSSLNVRPSALQYTLKLKKIVSLENIQNKNYILYINRVWCRALTKKSVQRQQIFWYFFVCKLTE